MSARILIVETEAQLARLIQRNLEGAGYLVDAVARDADADIYLHRSSPDLVVLDAIALDTPGADLCNRVRAYAEKAATPIITLVDRDADGLRGLEAGADDFVVKPLATPDLLARVRAILRRARPNHAAHILRTADVELDRECHRATRVGRALHLGPTEFRLLEFFMQNPGRVFSREELITGVWPPKAKVDLRTVDVHIGRLRNALNRGSLTDLVRTVRGVGYAFT